MHHSKPVLHAGRGDSASERNGGLAESLTLRIPEWMRTALDDVEAEPPLAFEADDASGVAREFIAAGLLDHWLSGYRNNDSIADGVTDVDVPESPHETLDKQLTIRMPRWMRRDIDDVSGEGEMYVADGVSATTRELISTGYRYYLADSFPYGEPVPTGAKLRCPGCYEDGVFAIWQRTFEFWGDRTHDLWDELSTERHNPYREFIQTDYAKFGWWESLTELESRSHPLHGVSHPDSEHPDVETEVTVCHCHLCGHTDSEDEFRRTWYEVK